MPIKFGDLYSGTNASVSDNTLINSIFGNPVTVAILIILIIVLLVTYTFRQCDCDGKYRSLISFSVYGGILVFLVLFLHNNCLLKLYRDRERNDDMELLHQKNQPFENRVDLSKRGRGERLNDESDESDESEDILSDIEEDTKLEGEPKMELPDNDSRKRNIMSKSDLESFIQEIQ